MKEKYIDLMEIVIGAYSDAHINRYVEKVRAEGLSEHGFPRLTANIGILIAHGRRRDLKDIFVQMMDICCKQIPTALARHRGVGNEFSVKEIVACLLALEESHVFSSLKTAYWREQLKSMRPDTSYKGVAKYEGEKVSNWAAFAAASEQARKYAGLGAEEEFIDLQILSQLSPFDENGMYRDPNEPMVYDLTARLQLSVALYFGYDGRYREQLENVLKKGAENTLFMQSVKGEIPFGGRSNQFLHNEAVLAALMEFEASRHKKNGDIIMAGQFKAAAAMARDAIAGYLTPEELRHIKNYYPQDGMYGCEEYAYFDKYMVTTASFLYLAYLFAEDEIQPTGCPANAGKYIYQTSNDFHKTMLKFGAYFAEYDTKADFHYDANGLGRIHREGAPSAICLSMPCTMEPSYKLDVENEMSLTICWGVKNDEEYVFSCEQGTEYELLEKSVTDTEVIVKWRCRLRNGCEAVETCVVKEGGVRMSFQAIKNSQNICCLLPAFAYDGKYKTHIETRDNCLLINYCDWQCRYAVIGSLQDEMPVLLKDTGKICANRNGHYRAFMAESGSSIEVDITINK